MSKFQIDSGVITYVSICKQLVAPLLLLIASSQRMCRSWSCSDPNLTSVSWQIGRRRFPLSPHTCVHITHIYVLHIYVIIYSCVLLCSYESYVPRHYVLELAIGRALHILWICDANGMEPSHKDKSLSALTYFLNSWLK